MPRSPVQCPICGKELSYKNLARHARDVCHRPTQAKCIQEWCDKHGWFASAQRKRHYHKLHRGELIPARKDCALLDPVTGRKFSTDPARKRTSTESDEESRSDADDSLHGDDGPTTDDGDHDTDTLVADDESLSGHNESSRGDGPPPKRRRLTREGEPRGSKSTLDVQDIAQQSWRTHIAALSTMKEMDETFMTPEIRLTRYGAELPLYRQIVEAAVEPVVYSYADYLDVLSTRPEQLQNERHSYVVCLRQEAEMLFRRGKPAINVMVPKLRPPRITLEGPHQFFAQLRAFPSIEVHDFNQVIDAAGSHILPVTMSPGDTIAAMTSDDRTPINLLDLDARIQNPVPDCLADLHDWSLLTNLPDTNHGGKQSATFFSDLSAGAAFHVCGKQGSFSFPHMDNHGVDTTVVVEDGSKLWYTFPRLAATERHQWAEGEDWAPAVPCFPVALEPGDFWYQPNGTVHAPYSVTTCLITGTKHWHSAHMLPVLQQSLFERQHPSVTNEDEARESYRKLRLVEQLWKSQSPAWNWGSPQELVEFSRLLDDEYESHYACGCTRGCISKSCKCFTMGKPCGKFCHGKHAATADPCQRLRPSLKQGSDTEA